MLKELKVVQTGEFILASGKKSNYFVNIKRASTSPKVLKEIGKAMAPYVGDAKIAGMALGAVPLAVAVALTTQCPYCIEIHTANARRAGATEAEIVEAGMVARLYSMN